MIEIVDCSFEHTNQDNEKTAHHSVHCVYNWTDEAMSEDVINAFLNYGNDNTS